MRIHSGVCWLVSTSLVGEGAAKERRSGGCPLLSVGGCKCVTRAEHVPVVVTHWWPCDWAYWGKGEITLL